VVLTTDEVFQAFYDDYENLTGFLHSHSYTGNPLGCAAALATLRIFEEDDVINANRTLVAEMAGATAHLLEHPHIAEVRQTGMILAIEMVKEKKGRVPYPWQERRGLRVYQYGLKNGVLIRPLGNVIYFMPPYVITPDQIRLLARIAEQGIDLATR
jgi:adenosylmethionine-8-amino-7-oxononanoate aminotransferase